MIVFDYCKQGLFFAHNPAVNSAQVGSFARTSNVLAFAEKAEILTCADDWKKARDVRNQINREYEENERVLAPLIAEMANCVPTLFLIHDRAVVYCADRLGVEKD